MPVRFDAHYASAFFAQHELEYMANPVRAAHDMLHQKKGQGSDFLGWVDLPVDYDRAEFARIQAAAARIQADSDLLVVVGIGGSYLGARAAIEFLNGPLYNLKKKNAPDILFAGNTLDGSALREILELCEGRRVSLNIISKSGTTTEPAIAFRFLRAYMEKRYGAAEAARRIICTTDRARGTLKELADANGYETFTIPDDVGGRFSVLTAVGLLPIAVSGADIAALMRGAGMAREAFASPELGENECYQYAASRHIFARKGKAIELLTAYEPRFAMMTEWWKQLFGESEGKDGKGLFPASAICTTDLHSMGQFMQEGTRNLLETIVAIGPGSDEPIIPALSEDGDGLNFLAGRPLSAVNRKAMEGTLLAHGYGGLPCLVVDVPKADEENLGELFYFFEKACAISGYLLGVNPFDQPGVESYKKNMFALLGKPGYEAEKKALEQRLKR